jgi:hypothetical protein
MWSLDRGADTCVACHTNVDPMNGNAMVPLAQLDLGNGPSDLEADHFKSYRELLSPDQGETLNAGGMLVPITIQVPLLDADGNPVLDAMGNPILVDVPDPSAGVTPSMSTAGARSSRFFDVFDAGGTHAGFLSGAELKMLAEWLDVGAQYYNNPFEPGVPTN